MSDVTDIAGVPIEIGDTVVYGVKSEYSTLQIGIVEDLIPWENTRYAPNPYHNPNLPNHWDAVKREYPNPTHIREKFTDHKIKVRALDTESRDAAGFLRVYKGSAKTLPNPSRFAVIKKGK